jgi:CHAP domain
MSVVEVLNRIAEIRGALAPPSVTTPPPAAAGVAGASGAGGDFSTLLQSASAGAPVSAAGAVPAGTGGAGVLAAVQREVGVAEQPPGSNDAPRIAQYRQATAGSGVGPWCAYFVSWAAREAGMPIGDSGQGFGRVDDVYAWAQRTGRAVPNGPGVVPRPGDLIVWDEHIGVVEAVKPDGSVQTVEGNSSDRVSRRTHAAGSALGYVRMG